MITHLTPEQEAFIPVYQEKWRNVGFSIEKINRKKAEKSVNKVYTLNGLSKPEITFIDSPCTELSESWFKTWIEPRGEIDSYLSNQFCNQIEKSVWNLISAELFHVTTNQYRALTDLYFSLENLIASKIYRIDGYNTFNSKYWLGHSCLFDFCSSVLNCAYPARHLQAVQDVVQHCGLIFCSESLAIICDRPRILSFDSQNHLHAEAKPAIQFADGCSIYANHGVILPEKYGKLHPNQWQAEWLLEEQNAGIRRVLIQGIGYSRICHASFAGSTATPQTRSRIASTRIR